MKNNNKLNDEFNLYDYFRILWKFKFLVVSFVILSLILAFVLTKRIIPMYKSKVTVIINQESSGGGGLSSVLGGIGFGSLVAGNSDTAVLREVLESKRMRSDIINEFKLIDHYNLSKIDSERIEGLADKLGLSAKELINIFLEKGIVNDRYQLVSINMSKKVISDIFPGKEKYFHEFMDKLKVKQQLKAIKIVGENTSVDIGKTKILKLEVDDHDPRFAANIANFYMKNLDRLNEQLQITTQKPMVQVLDPASPSLRPYKPKLKKNLILAFVFSLCLSFFLIFLSLFF